MDRWYSASSYFEPLFIWCVNQSIAVLPLIGVILILRYALKRSPKSIRILLWAFVAVRLLCPFSITTPLSFFSVVDTPLDASGNISYLRYLPDSERPMVLYDTPVFTQSIESSESGVIYTHTDVALNTHSTFLPPFVAVWFIGGVVMLIYAVVSWLCLRKRVSAALCLDGNLMLCDEIDSPFVFGVLRPKVYVPSSVPEQQLPYIVAHENAHMERRDYLWKPLGFIILSVYWFNPAIWLSYILFCRDIELACDERVIKRMESDVRADYSQALLDFSISKHKISVCPIAFGENGARERIRAVLNYQKPTVWITTVSVIICAAVFVCFLTNPVVAATASSESVTIPTSIPIVEPEEEPSPTPSTESEPSLTINSEELDGSPNINSQPSAPAPGFTGEEPNRGDPSGFTYLVERKINSAQNAESVSQDVKEAFTEWILSEELFELCTDEWVWTFSISSNDILLENNTVTLLFTGPDGQHQLAYRDGEKAGHIESGQG